jgi:hypothetical protein
LDPARDVVEAGAVAEAARRHSLCWSRVRRCVPDQLIAVSMPVLR